MNFDEYQIEARKTAIYPNLGNNFIYPTFGLCGETGEIAEKIKKVIRDDNDKITYEKRVELVKELGDVLWYISNLATELDMNLNIIAEENIRKLQSRLQRNKIHGDGDNR